MRGVFDDEEYQQAEPQRDTEVTLGNGTLLLMVLGLLVICAVCFGLGYALGHRNAQPSAAAGETQTAQATQAPTQTHETQAKPSASAQPAAVKTPSQSDGAQPAAVAPQSASSVVVPVSSQPVSSQEAASASQPQVRPALPPVAIPPQVNSALSAHPAIPSATQFMVQIAAVSHQEDADVLIGALRKRGYAVSAHREPVDNLIHVRIGPFNNRDEANRWRIKLLDDGYNALIQP